MQNQAKKSPCEEGFFLSPPVFGIFLVGFITLQLTSKGFNLFSDTLKASKFNTYDSGSSGKNMYDPTSGCSVSGNLISTLKMCPWSLLWPGRQATAKL